MHFSVDGFLLRESNVVATQKSNVRNEEDKQFENVNIFISNREIEELYRRMKNAEVND